MKEQSRQIDFIDREDEWSKIDARVSVWGDKNIICVDGPGGIGKTRLINEVRSRYINHPPQFSQSSNTPRFKVAWIQEFTTPEESDQLLHGARQMADDLGIDLNEYEAASNIESMVKQLETAINQKHQVIVLRQGNHERILTALQPAFEAGIKVIVLDNYLPEKRITSRVIQDFLDGGVQLVRQLAQEVDYKGDILAVYDPQQSFQSSRFDILQDAMQPYPDIRIKLKIQPDPQSLGKSLYNSLYAALGENDALRAIWVASDEYIEPTLRAIKASSYKNCSVYSYGLNPSQATALLDSNSPWRATVAASPAEVGKYSMSLAALAAMNETLERSYSFPAERIDKEKLRLLLDAEGNLPAEWLKIDLPWTPQLRARQNAFSRERRLFHPIAILDFDDDAVCDPENILYQIAQMMGADTFSDYLDLLTDTGDAQTEFNRRPSSEKFQECFNKIAQTQRVLFFFDTVDNENQISTLQRVFKVFLGLNNFVCIIAGRKVNRLHALLAVDQSWKNHAQVLPLEPFAEKFGQLYLLKKQEHLGFTIDPVLGQNLLLLAQGRPILIDLAADWLAREIPLEWLRDKNTDKLKEELSGPDKEQKILEFQNRLVQYIGQGRRELDWLFLIMAHIFPLDIPLIQALRKLNLESAEKLFSEAQTYTFVKRLPDGRIKLHDVMQEMINEFVWKELDDEKERRRRDSQLALNFYAERLKKIEDEINQSATANKEKFIEREKLYRELYILHGSHLNHLFYTDLSKGVREFKQLFEQATLFARLSSRKNLLDATTAYLSELTFDDKYHVNTRWVRYWLDEGQIEQARAILDQLFAYPTLTPEQLLGLHTNEANYFIKAHKLPDAIRSLEKANESCEQNPGELGNYRGTVLNTLGWVYRQMGNHTLAAEYYDHALGATLDPLKVASILNNAGYVHSFDGLYDKAIEYCQEALAMRETGKDIQGQGKSYSTIGDVYRNMGNYQKSLEAYNKAFEIFEPEHVRPWLAYIYSHRGAVLRLLKRPEEARKDILASIHLNVQKELPWAYHVLGCLYWDEMNWSDALKYFDKSDQYAIDIGDMHTQVNNMVGSAEIFYQKWAESGWKNDSQTELILKKAATLQDVIQQGYEFPHHQGRMLRVLADTAFRQNRHEEALHYYAEAYSLLGRRSAGYGPTTFRDEFDRVEKNIMYLAQGEKQPAVALHWCKYIKEYLASKPDILQASALIGKCTLLETKIRLKVVVSPTGA